MRTLARILPLLLSVVVLAAACSGSDGADDTTTLPAGETSTTVAGETTTTVAGDTTTTTGGSGETTTTVAGETTTTVAGDTTTTTGGETTTTGGTTTSGATTTTTAGGSTTTSTLGETSNVALDDPRGFGFDYPSWWSAEQDDFGDYLVTAPFSSSTDAFAESVEVYVDDFSTLSPLEYGELIAEQLEGFFGDDFVLVAQGPTTIGGRTAYNLEYELTDETRNLRYREGYVEFDGALINLIYVGSGDGYDEWRSDADVIWDTFRFTG